MVQLFPNDGRQCSPFFLLAYFILITKGKISEITPHGKEFLFFSLFGIIGKTSSLIGPIICSAIIDGSSSGNSSTPFYFLMPLSLVSFVGLLFFVDVSQSKKEQELFLKNEQVAREQVQVRGRNP